MNKINLMLFLMIFLILNYIYNLYLLLIYNYTLFNQNTPAPQKNSKF